MDVCQIKMFVLDVLHLQSSQTCPRPALYESTYLQVCISDIKDSLEMNSKMHDKFQIKLIIGIFPNYTYYSISIEK